MALHHTNAYAYTPGIYYIHGEIIPTLIPAYVSDCVSIVLLSIGLVASCLMRVGKLLSGSRAKPSTFYVEPWLKSTRHLLVSVRHSRWIYVFFPSFDGEAMDTRTLEVCT